MVYIEDMVRRWKSLWWLPALIVSAILNIFFFVHKPPAGVNVIGVIDGDTIVLEGKSKVRLRYIDAPEKGLCGYDEATNELKNLALGESVRVEETIPDQYGRGMALVYDGNTLINKQMLASGWVRYHSDNSLKTDELKKTADEAKNKRRGVYGKCQSQDIPDKPNCIIKGNLDKNSDARTYYLPDCAQYKFTVVEKDSGENWFCTEKEARAAGFVKAATCKQ